MKFSKKRLIAFLKWKEHCQEKALKDPEKPIQQRVLIYGQLIRNRVLINEIKNWKFTELSYGKEIDKFV